MKNKLNQPDVEVTTTTTGESINLNITIPSKQFTDIFTKQTNIQEDKPTFEEVKKEWEELGYEFTIYTAEDDTMRKFDISKYGEKIILWYDHSYSKVGNTDHCFTIQEHNLLTKTFKALGW